MKTNEELDAIKNEVNALKKKLAELSEDELKEVTGGTNAVPGHQYYQWKGIVYTKLFDDCPGQSNYGCERCPHRRECADFSILDLSNCGIPEEDFNQQRRT